MSKNFEKTANDIQNVVIFESDLSADKKSDFHFAIMNLLTKYYHQKQMLYSDLSYLIMTKFHLNSSDWETKIFKIFNDANPDYALYPGLVEKM